MIVPTKTTVVVGMSGGVDSSVSALLLKSQGYHVIGMFMKNWEEQDANGQCMASADYDDVVRVCGQIDIPLYSVNFSKEYWRNVFTQTLEDFRAGLTPNPDVLCNREIKFKMLLEKALQMGAQYLATGHYCRINTLPNGHYQLLKGIDPGKDQSYFLHMVSENVLDRVLFPIGHLPKSEVRSIAAKNGLATAEKEDSTGVCFIGERNFKQFLSQYITPSPGNFEDTDGNVVGSHDGIAYYTIGQRKGLGIGGAGEPWFVVGKDVQRNVVILAQGNEHPALYRDSLTAHQMYWISKEGPPSIPFDCKAKVRYRQPDQKCTITEITTDGLIKVVFVEPQRAITPHQSVVFYDGDTCLGGGLIL